MPPANSVDDLLDSLTVVEQIELLAGTDFWHTAAIERLGIPAIRVTDGPAGARGTSFDGPASVNVPCSSALAATWDPTLVEEVGHLLGREVRAKGARVHLAPTVNLHRTPIGGRNFECMSEDPYLTARTAVAYVRGVQAEGVASCIKHFVGNDTEFERNTIDSRIDERTLRELYLVPFEAAVREAGVLSIMTGYNRLNGPFCADSTWLLAEVLRGEWGFGGLVMSDWFGLHSTAAGLHAGLDLEMPGPTRHRGQRLLDALERGDVTAGEVRAAAGNVIALLRRVDAFGDGAPGPETTVDTSSDRALVRRAASSGMVLVRNRARPDSVPVLPLSEASLRRVAIIGPNATNGRIMGGGSAWVRATHISQPLDALARRFDTSGITVDHAPGCAIYKRLPPLDPALCSPIVTEFFDEPAAAANPSSVSDRTIETSSSRQMWTADPLDPERDPRFGARLRTTFTPDVDGPWRFGISSVAIARLLIDGRLLLDNESTSVGGSFFGMGRDEITATHDMAAGTPYEIEVQLERERSEAAMSGLNVGAYPPETGDSVADAVELAATSDLSILVVGTNDDWESEGWDRDDLDLPGRQDELIQRVADVSARTVVVVNAGSPVKMPWLDAVDAVVVAWFPGQEFGDALADVLFGDAEPQGRLPITFPRRMEDTPAFEHHPGRNGVANYGERRLIGYRWYDTVGREPLFPFGHGLGYAVTEIVAARLIDHHNVEVDVSNTSDREGYEVVQVYAHRVDRAGLEPDEPEQRLVGFTKVAVPANGRSTAAVALDPRSYQGWNVDGGVWTEIAGSYELRVGRSSRDITERLPVER